MYLELARKYFLKATNSSGGTRKYFANLCQVCLAKIGKTPKDIGITNEDLANLLIDTNKKKKKKAVKNKVNPRELCSKYLEQAKAAKGASKRYYVNLFLSAIAKFQISCESFGTSEKELDELQKKGFLESAHNYLQEAKNSIGTKRKCYADLCWEYLEKAKCGPKDIGSSEEELAKICVQ